MTGQILYISYTTIYVLKKKSTEGAWNTSLAVFKTRVDGALNNLPVGGVLGNGRGVELDNL